MRQAEDLHLMFQSEMQFMHGESVTSSIKRIFIKRWERFQQAHIQQHRYFELCKQKIFISESFEAYEMCFTIYANFTACRRQRERSSRSANENELKIFEFSSFVVSL